MRPEKPQVVVLCEDRKQDRFIRQFLKIHGIGSRKTTVDTAPRSKGAADAFIRQRFPSEVKAYRSKRNYMNVCLIVIIDADPPNSPEDRKRMLDQALQDQGAEKLTQNDRVAIVVPKRNIETWMHFLTDQETDEQTDYKQSHPDSDCKPCAKKLKELQLQFRGGTPPENLPDSLQQACHELERICRCE